MRKYFADRGVVRYCYGNTVLYFRVLTTMGCGIFAIRTPFTSFARGLVIPIKKTGKFSEIFLCWDVWDILIFRDNTIMVFQEKIICPSAKKDRKLGCFLFVISIRPSNKNNRTLKPGFLRATHT